MFEAEPQPLSAAGSYGLTVAWWVALVALVALAISPWLAWEEGVNGWRLLDHSDVRLHGQVLQVVFLGPTVLVGALALAHRGALASGWAAAFAAAGCAGVGLTLADSAVAWPGWGAGIAVFAYPPALFALALLTWLAHRGRRGRVERVWVAVVAVAAAIVVGGGACVGAYWYAVARVTDHETAPAAAAAAPPGGQPGRLLWRARSATVFLIPPRSSGDRASYYGPVVTLAFGLVATTDAQGDRLEVSSLAGAERWHYAHAGAELLGAIPATGGQLLVAFFEAHGQTTALGFDARTGAIRWQRWLGDLISNFGPSPSGGLGYWLRPTPAAVIALQGSRRLEGISTTTGATDWSVSLSAICGGPGGWGEGRLTVLETGCNSGPALLALGPSGSRWTYSPQLRGDVLEDWLPAVQAATANNVIAEWDWFNGHYQVGKLAALDPATGRVRFSLTQPLNLPGQPSRQLFTAADDNALLSEQPGRSRSGRPEFFIRDALTGVPISRWTTNPAFAGAIRGDRAYLLENSGIEVRDVRTGRAIAFYRLGAPAGDQPVSLDAVDGALIVGDAPRQGGTGTVEVVKLAGG